MRSTPVPEDLLRRVVAVLDPRRVILFGSRARGDAGPDSDIDLFVVVDDDAPRERTSWRASYEARRGYAGAVDIVTCRSGTYLADRAVPGSVVHEIERDGVVVYDGG